MPASIGGAVSPPRAASSRDAEPVTTGPSRYHGTRVAYALRYLSLRHIVRVVGKGLQRPAGLAIGRLGPLATTEFRPGR